MGIHFGIVGYVLAICMCNFHNILESVAIEGNSPVKDFACVSGEEYRVALFVSTAQSRR